MSSEWYRFKGEWIKPERWGWEAHYRDGSVLKQFDDKGYFHQSGEIDQKRLLTFHMVSRQNPSRRGIIEWRPEYELIHFYRNTIAHDGSLITRLYCYGYNIKSTGEYTIYVISPDDSIQKQQGISQQEVCQ